MANSFPASGLAYADAFSVGTANAAASSLYVCSSCVQATRIEHTYSQTNLHHNTLWLRAMNSGAKAAASIGFTVVNNGGDHHRANIEATANSSQIGGNLALYTRNNNGNDTLGYYQDHAGNVGIGTSSPSYLLDIPRGNNLYLGNLYITGCALGPVLSSGGTGGSMCLQGGGGGEGAIHLQGGTSGNGFISFLTNSTTERMRIINNGNVGINVSSPSTKLHICNPVNQAYNPLAFNSDLHALHIQFCNQNQRAGLIRFTSHGNLENTFGVVQVGCAAAGCGQGDFVFQAYREAGGAAYSELMRLTNTGNVGIGTSSPGAKLTVSRASETTAYQLELRVVGGISDGNYDGITFTQGSSGATPLGSIRMKYTSNGYPGFGIYTRSGDNQESEKLTILNGGNVGIGTTSPNNKLTVNGSVGLTGYNWKVYSDSDVNWGFGLCNNASAYYTYLSYAPDATQDRRGGIFNIAGNSWVAYGNCNSHFIVTNNLGVGTATPVSKLHVEACGAGGQSNGPGVLQIKATGNDIYTWGSETYGPNLTSCKAIVHLIGVCNTTKNAAYWGFRFCAQCSNSNLQTFGFWGSDDLMSLTAGGNLGVNTLTPSKKLTVRHGDADGIRVEYTGNTDNLLIDASGIQAFAGATCSILKLNPQGGSVGVGTPSPSYRLHVNGTFYAAGSSIDYKEGICQYNTDSCLFMCLKPKAYQYKDEWKHLGKELKSETQIGLIAEEVAEIMPELAILVNEDDNKVVRNVDYEKLSIVLLAEVQKLRQEVDQLKK